MKMKMAISILTVAQSLAPVLAPAHRLALPQEPREPQASASAPQCSEIDKNEITITCAYTAGSPGGADRGRAPRVILNLAVISFVASNDSHMRVELTFTNDSGSKITDRRAVYLAIDDERGENHMRRFLPHVDFTRLEPGKPAKFQEVFAGAGIFSRRLHYFHLDSLDRSVVEVRSGS